MRAPALLALRIVVALTGLAPWVLAVARVRTPELEQAFHTLCHQRPERTLAIFGAPMLVCSRCAGVYAGVFLGVLMTLPRRLLGHGRAIVLGAMAAALVEIGAQDLGLHAPWHPTRLATGLALGWSASAFMFASLVTSRPLRVADGEAR